VRPGFDGIVTERIKHELHKTYRGDRIMKKYRVYASEIVCYMKNVESENEEELKSLIQSGDVMFDNEDIVDGGDFELVNIEEIK
jgi:hypothetical protein